MPLMSENMGMHPPMMGYGQGMGAMPGTGEIQHCSRLISQVSFIRLRTTLLTDKASSAKCFVSQCYLKASALASPILHQPLDLFQGRCVQCRASWELSSSASPNDAPGHSPDADGFWSKQLDLLPTAVCSPAETLHPPFHAHADAPAAVYADAPARLTTDAAPATAATGHTTARR